MKNSEEKQYYMPRIRIPYNAKRKLDALKATTGLSLSVICLKAIEEKYDIVLLPGDIDRLQSKHKPE